MSATIVDMAKVTQMLDAGWKVRLFKNGLGSYSAVGRHDRKLIRAAVDKLVATAPAESRDIVREMNDDPDAIDTDDFTPEQALTRLAYKIHGEVI